jgi:hypothetical protein
MNPTKNEIISIAGSGNAQDLTVEFRVEYQHGRVFPKAEAHHAPIFFT